MFTEKEVDSFKTMRKFIPYEFRISTWDDLSSYYDDLLSRKIESLSDLRKWLSDRNEIEAALQEDVAWRYIRMSCDTENKELSDNFNFYVSEIEPKVSPYSNKLNQKLLDCEFLSEYNEPGIDIMLRSIRKQVEIFREENIPLFAELQQKEQIYANIAGAMTVEVDGKEITLQQASNFLKDTDRKKRKEVFIKIMERRLQDKKKLDDLFDDLISIRHKIAVNAGFENFRDYMFAALGRFDYTSEDCYEFHDSIASELVTLVRDIHQNRKESLGYDKLCLWDMDVDISGKPALEPFHGQEELMERTIDCFSRLHPFLGNCMVTLREMEYVDLDSRKGKAPGGFNYPLYESGVPFIFMNSSNSIRDLVTIVHEGGHAVHSIVTRDLAYNEFKNTPSEVAELASMSMELLSLEKWDSFFKEDQELKRARMQHLESILISLPWIAAIDKFQHWIYTNPGHDSSQRKESWNRIIKEFSTDIVSKEGYEEAISYSWQKQLHLYQVPFYYIEYGMAQLGAIAIWKNFKSDPELTLEQYLKALKLGYTATIGKIYETAGIRFDFSRDYIKELSRFVKGEVEKLAKS